MAYSIYYICRVLVRMNAVMVYSYCNAIIYIDPLTRSGLKYTHFSILLCRSPDDFTHQWKSTTS